jgi:SIT family siderophore-iron:H+ symporter-like MFS transporter
MTLGLIVMKVRRLKPFIVAGAITYTLAFGLLIRFRGGHGGGQVNGVIAAEVLLGIGGGFFSYPGTSSKLN